jgi:hypothetical protein
LIKKTTGQETDNRGDKESNHRRTKRTDQGMNDSIKKKIHHLVKTTKII